jgi:hypothetical protein
MCHELPFQRSANGTTVLLEDPTAVQAVAALHETPLRTMYVAPAGLGVGWICQAVPFQRSASDTMVLPLLYTPTAVQAVAELHETAPRPPPVGVVMD